MAGLAHQRSRCRYRRLRGFRRTREGAEIHRCRGARHGRIEPRARSACRNLRQEERLPEAARARLHRSRPGARDGERRRYRQDAVHRLLQIRRHHRAERDEGLFLRSRRQGDRQGQGRPPLHRYHRFRLIAGEGRDQTGFCPRLPWRADHRRALFGALAVWSGAGRRGRHRCAQADRQCPAHGALLRRGRAAA